jgi:multidrug resistance efflux pump
MFRARALEALQRGDDPAVVLDVMPPRLRLLYGTLIAMCVLGMSLAVIGRAEVTGDARGVVRASSASVVLRAPVSGLLQTLHSEPGAWVRAGATVVTLRAARTEASAQRAAEEVALLERQYEAYRRSSVPLIERERGILSRKAKLLRQLQANGRRQVERLERRVARERLLQSSGVTSTRNLEDVQAALDEARGEVLEHGVALSDLQGALNQLEARRLEEQRSWEMRLQQAKQERQMNEALSAESLLRAPSDGRFEALSVEPGELVAEGAPLAKIVPGAAELRVVALLPQRHAAFVKVGDTVRVEVDGMNAAEFGRLSGRIERIAREPAPAFEVEQLLGEPFQPGSPLSRVDVKLLPSEHHAAVLARLQSGTRTNVRYTVRRRRVLFLALEPLERWLE